MFHLRILPLNRTSTYFTRVHVFVKNSNQDIYTIMSTQEDKHTKARQILKIVHREGLALGLSIGIIIGTGITILIQYLRTQL